MTKEFNPVRYSVITEKNPREIVMLRGRGCAWLRCTFCDYHTDCSRDEAENFALNKSVLDNVSGIYKTLEVINSGSFAELDESTMEYISMLCAEKGITQVHFESHWMYRSKIPALRRRFSEKGIRLKLKIGVESFDARYREEILKKGIDEENPALIAADFDECCLLQGLAGQTAESMSRDIETGLRHFERVCVNIMQPNSTDIAPDQAVIDVFVKDIYPEYIKNSRVDILLENTDFGVGGEEVNSK